jgi:hypothetical protein
MKDGEVGKGKTHMTRPSSELKKNESDVPHMTYQAVPVRFWLSNSHVIK